MDTVKLIECPRDAWQGLPAYIPAKAKATYLHALIKAGFRHLDAVSFVSPRHVPQMADSEAVMATLTARLRKRDKRNPKFEIGNSKLEIGNSKPGTGNWKTEKDALPDGSGPPVSSFQFPVSSFHSEIIGIVVNEKGLRRALATPGVTTLGYPHSISAHFLQDNAHITIDASRALVEWIKSQADASGRGFVVYLSMAFGNPYGEPWHPEQVGEAVDWLRQAGIREISLADTVGKARPADVENLLRFVRQRLGESAELEIGVHLHSRQESAAEKVLAAYEAGCRRFDGALTGLGGCPFAGDELVGNIATEIVVDALRSQGADVGIAADGLSSALEVTRKIRESFLERQKPKARPPSLQTKSRRKR